MISIPFGEVVNDSSEYWRSVWGNSATHETRGAIFTRPEIVELILDLSGYTADKPLWKKRLLEPGCGESAFLQAIIGRLMTSFKASGESLASATTLLRDSICAIDIDQGAITKSGCLIRSLLQVHGLSPADADELASNWLVHGDFLLQEWTHSFSYIIGNPPYVRIEALPKKVLEVYRRLFRTASNRADLYIPFFERSLQLLTPDGALGFICTNRFVRNRYGGELRELIASNYHVRFYVDLQHTQPFLSKVSAYPAIFVLDRKRGEPTRTASLDNISPVLLDRIRDDAKASRLAKGALLSEFASWYPGGQAWLASSTDELDILHRLESEFPVLEESGDKTKAGIGVATGADKVFVVKGNPGIEADRMLPMAMAYDLSSQDISWSEHYIINTFAPQNDGSLVDLEAFPLLRAYLLKHEAQLQGRHVAKRSGGNWYRTIDRVWPSLVSTPKLLIPDIQKVPVVAYDRGQLYPHHNVYFITSEGWDLLALKTILRSSIVLFQVQAVSVQMRGGAFRFQTQTLRKIRLPHVTEISSELLTALASASTSLDQDLIDNLVRQAYGFTAAEAKSVRSKIRP